MTTCDTEYDFTFVLEEPTEVTLELENTLLACGCDDATLSSRFGRLRLTFSRSAPSLKDAMISAIKDLKKTHPTVRIQRMER